MDSRTKNQMLIALTALGFAIAQPALGQMGTTLYNFCSQPNCTDGAVPSSGSLARDAKGNLYGATMLGGAYNLGTIFELTPSGNGWTETVLYSFSGGTGDGSYPWAGLILGKKGTIYGTTNEGGAYTNGIVFELSPPAKKGGAWTKTILHNFGAAGDGAIPREGVIMDKAGNLYGTTQGGGGTDVDGTVFELSPPTQQGGVWTETILHTFVAGTGDGLYPGAGVVFHGKNLYGTTTYGGSDYGTVFELSPPTQQGGAWTESFLYSFQYETGSYYPYAVPIFDKKGNLYGTTDGGYGSVFKLTKKGEETTILICLANNPFPESVLLFDAAGNLYGTTNAGVFELTPPAWTLQSFDNIGDGSNPNNGLIFDPEGNLYGTTVDGPGTYCPSQNPNQCGTVFEVTP